MKNGLIPAKQVARQAEAADYQRNPTQAAQLALKAVALSGLECLADVRRFLGAVVATYYEQAF